MILSRFSFSLILLSGLCACVCSPVIAVLGLNVEKKSSQGFRMIFLQRDDSAAVLLRVSPARVQSAACLTCDRTETKDDKTKQQNRIEWKRKLKFYKKKRIYQADIGSQGKS